MLTKTFNSSLKSSIFQINVRDMHIGRPRSRKYLWMFILTDLHIIIDLTINIIDTCNDSYRDTEKEDIETKTIFMAGVEISACNLQLRVKSLNLRMLVPSRTGECQFSSNLDVNLSLPRSSVPRFSASCVFLTRGVRLK